MTLYQKEYSIVLAGKLEKKRSKYTNPHIFKVLPIRRWWLEEIPLPEHMIVIVKSR
jgi:hypothetical protein